MAELELANTEEQGLFVGFGLGLAHMNYLAHIGFGSLGLSYLAKKMVHLRFCLCMANVWLVAWGVVAVSSPHASPANTTRDNRTSFTRAWSAVLYVLCHSRTTRSGFSETDGLVSFFFRSCSLMTVIVRKSDGLLSFFSRSCSSLIGPTIAYSVKARTARIILHAVQSPTGNLSTCITSCHWRRQRARDDSELLGIADRAGVLRCLARSADGGTCFPAAACRSRVMKAEWFTSNADLDELSEGLA